MNAMCPLGAVTFLRARARETQLGASLIISPPKQPRFGTIQGSPDSRVAIRCQTGCAAQAVDPLRSCLERVVADRPRRAQ